MLKSRIQLQHTGIIVLGILISLALGMISQSMIVPPPLVSAAGDHVNATTFKPTWNITWGGFQDDLGFAIVEDGSGNIIMSGGTKSFSLGQNDAFLAKFTPDGRQLWNATWGGTYDDFAYGVAVDAGGYVYVAGRTEILGGTDQDAILAKYGPTGTQEWSLTWGGSEWDGGVGVSLDGAGNVYMAGYYNSTILGSYGFLLKCTPGGAILWNRTWGGPGGAGYYSGTASKADGFGNLYVGGKGNDDLFLVKFNSTGDQLWNQTCAGPNHEDCMGMAVDASGNVVMTGSSDNYVDTRYALLLKYNATGTLEWNRTWLAGNKSQGVGVSIDGLGNIYLTGNCILDGAGGIEAIIAKYNAGGDSLQNWTWGGGGNDLFAGILVAASGEIFLCGGTTSWGAGGSDAILLRWELYNPKEPDNIPAYPSTLVLVVVLIGVAWVIVKKRHILTVPQK